LRKPTGLDSAKSDIKNQIENQQDSDIKSPSVVSNLPNIIPDPKNTMRSKLADTFNTIALNQMFTEMSNKIIQTEMVLNENSENPERILKTNELKTNIPIEEHPGKGLFSELIERKWILSINTFSFSKVKFPSITKL